MRADSRMATRRAASRSQRVLEGSGTAELTTETVMAMMATTTMSSSKVKPRDTVRRARPIQRPCVRLFKPACGDSLPGTDVGIPTFATALSIGAETEDIDLP